MVSLATPTQLRLNKSDLRNPEFFELGVFFMCKMFGILLFGRDLCNLKFVLTLQWNKKKIYASQSICGICGKPVNFGYKFPHPLSPCIDHIIPVSKGGHPSDISNLQLAHMTCNRDKSDKLFATKQAVSTGIELVSNRLLPLTFDWKTV